MRSNREAMSPCGFALTSSVGERGAWRSVRATILSPNVFDCPHSSSLLPLPFSFPLEAWQRDLRDPHVLRSVIEEQFEREARVGHLWVFRRRSMGGKQTGHVEKSVARASTR